MLSGVSKLYVAGTAAPTTPASSPRRRPQARSGATGRVCAAMIVVSDNAVAPRADAGGRGAQNSDCADGFVSTSLAAPHTSADDVALFFQQARDGTLLSAGARRRPRADQLLREQVTPAADRLPPAPVGQYGRHPRVGPMRRDHTPRAISSCGLSARAVAVLDAERPASPSASLGQRRTRTSCLRRRSGPHEVGAVVRRHPQRQSRIRRRTRPRPRGRNFESLLVASTLVFSTTTPQYRTPTAAASPGGVDRAARPLTALRLHRATTTTLRLARSSAHRQRNPCTRHQVADVDVLSVAGGDFASARLVARSRRRRDAVDHRGARADDTSRCERC